MKDLVCKILMKSSSLKDIYSDACSRGVWVEVISNFESRTYHVFSINKPNVNQILTQLSAAKIGNHGNTVIKNIPSIDSVIRNLEKTLYNSSVRKVDKTTISIIAELIFLSRDKFEQLSMLETGEQMTIDGGITVHKKLYKECDKRGIKIDTIKMDDKSFVIEKLSGVYKMIIGD